MVKDYLEAFGLASRENGKILQMITIRMQKNPYFFHLSPTLPAFIFV